MAALGSLFGLALADGLFGLPQLPESDCQRRATEDHKFQKEEAMHGARSPGFRLKVALLQPDKQV